MPFYDLSIQSPAGDSIPMSKFKDQVVLIVNTATRCGLAPQFEGLELLHQKYKDQGLVVIGFPSNQFANQEPETNDTMEEACQINHGVTFPLTEKIDVNGEQTHPIFQYLKKKKGGLFGSRIKWNFTKFLIDQNGTVVKRFSPTTHPQKIEKHILNLIAD